MSNAEIKVGMSGTVPVGKNQVKVEVTSIDGEMLTVKNLNTKKISEVKVARFTPEPAAAAPKASTAKTAKTADKATAAATKAKDKATTAKEAKSAKPDKKPGLLDNVAAILKKKGEPMTTNELIDELKAKGQLTLTGKTPKQTLYSSLYRAIVKGDGRFEKAGKNSFKHN